MFGASPDDDALVLDEERASDAVTMPRRAVRCLACGHALTSTNAKTRVNGAHAHTFKNPSGIDYRVGCFRDAPGCRGVGDASDVWTWFPGYAWRIALCGACAVHVGWTFARTGEGVAFVALVLERITES